MKKAVPKFKNEDAEREFWASHDSTDYIDWRRGKRATLPNLRPSSQTISLRLPKPISPAEPAGEQARCAISILAEDVRGRAAQSGV